MPILYTKSWKTFWDYLEQDEVLEVIVIDIAKDAIIIYVSKIRPIKSVLKIKTFQIENNSELIPNLYKLYKINNKLKDAITFCFKSGVVHSLVPAEYKDWYMAVVLGGKDEIK